MEPPLDTSIDAVTRVQVGRITIMADDQPGIPPTVTIDLRTADPSTPDRTRQQYLLRLAAFATVVAIFLGAVALHLWKIARVPIRAEIAASAVSLRLPSERYLMSGWEAASVTFTSLTTLTTGFIDGLPSLSEQSGAFAVDLKAEAGDSGQVRIKELRLPEGSRVLFEQIGAPDQYRVTYECDSPCAAAGEARLEVQGPVTIDVSGTSRTASLPPREITATLSSSTIMTVRLKSASEWLIDEQVSVSALEFSRRSHRGSDIGREQETVLSSVVGGLVSSELIKDRKHELHTGEQIGFGVVTGMVERIAVDTAQIAVSFSGIVRNLRSGSGSNSHSLMPSHLERLYYNDQLRFIFLVVSGAFPILFGGIKLLKRPAE